MNPYRLIARFYDTYLDQDLYQDMMKLLLQEKQSGQALDLATGTGQMAIALAKHGFHVDGADVSLDMLKEAEKQITKTALAINLYVHDILDPIGQTYDVITMASDIVNHLCAIEDVELAFTHVFHACKEGGVFVFDAIHQDYAEGMIGYKETLKGQYQPLEWSVERHTKESIKHTLTLGKETEELVQYIYPTKKLKDMLSRIGFTLIAESANDERTMFLVKKTT